MKKKAIIIAPFWNDPEHIGMYRVQRFFNWLAEEGYEIIIISVGDTNIINSYKWGKEIIIKDPLKIYRRKISLERKTVQVRKGNKYRRFFAYFLLIPDPLIFWVLKVFRDKSILSMIKDARVIISSSPPESAHVLAFKISNLTGAKLIIDLRDGWLDEPLKNVLKIYLRRFIEKSLEKKILIKADTIFVTSKNWKKLLQNRIVELQDKISVLSNGYPLQSKANSSQKYRIHKQILLLHAGRFKAGRNTHDISLIIRPLSSLLNYIQLRGEYFFWEI